VWKIHPGLVLGATVDSGLTNSCGIAISSWEAGSCVTTMSSEGTGSCVVVSVVMEGNGQRIGIACSISFHPIAVVVDLADRVLLLGKVETKTLSFFFVGFGEEGCSSTI
jgi:hypothetical protein